MKFFLLFGGFLLSPEHLKHAVALVSLISLPHRLPVKPFSRSVWLFFTSVGLSVCVCLLFFWFPPGVPLPRWPCCSTSADPALIFSPETFHSHLSAVYVKVGGKFFTIDDLRFGAIAAWGRGFNVSNHTVLELCIFGQFFFWLLASHSYKKETLLQTTYDT